MTHNHVRNWPPVWTKGIEKDAKRVIGEVGKLRQMHFSNQLSDRCYLLIEYRRENYVGTLIFDDTLFCRQIAAFLQTQIDQPIQEIGNLDVSYIL